MAIEKRQYQIGGLVRNCLSKALQYAKDERLIKITITSVMMTSDLREAKVYWVCGQEDKSELLKVVNTSAGYLRSYIAKNLKVRFIPKLHFFYDDTLDTSEEVERLINSIKID